MKNLREQKNSLRAGFRQIRESMDPDRKRRLDAAILARLLSLREYGAATSVYTYVSKPIEVDTFALIEAAAAGGRRVATPRCFPGTRTMRFYEIRSAGELKEGLYGVPEPDPDRSRPAAETGNVLCVVPGLGFDSGGYRLGYGKGYYDRFLSGFAGVAVGLCYSACTRWSLPHGYYDRPVDIVVTEKYVRRISGKRF